MSPFSVRLRRNRNGADIALTVNPCKSAQDLCRTRTDDPFLTMEVLYQLS